MAYLRDRLLLARELLHESGSGFVQIGDENVHRAGMVMDEIFGAENRMATISYATTGGSSTSHLPQIADYLLWYARDRRRMKYRQLYEPLTRAEVIESFSWHVMVELPDGQCRQPQRDTQKARVTGPFTVEAVPAPAVKSLDAIEEATSQADDVSVARSGETLAKATGATSFSRPAFAARPGRAFRSPDWSRCLEPGGCTLMVRCAPTIPVQRV